MSTKTILSLYDIFMDVVSKKIENTETINIERLYLSGYDQYIYDENMKLTLYNYIYYRGSRDDIKKEINNFIDDYYDRYAGLYLKSKDFLKKVIK